MPDIRHSIQISAPAAQVFPLISTAQGWAQWWAQDVSESSGTIKLGFFNRSTVYRLKQIANDPSAYSEWLRETGANGRERGWYSGWNRRATESHCVSRTPVGVPILITS